MTGRDGSFMGIPSQMEKAKPHEGVHSGSCGGPCREHLECSEKLWEMQLERELEARPTWVQSKEFIPKLDKVFVCSFILSFIQQKCIACKTSARCCSPGCWAHSGEGNFCLSEASITSG